MFRSFCFSPEVKTKKETARAILQNLYPGIKEVQKAIGNDTLTIATQDELLKHYGDFKFYVTINLLEDIYEMKYNKIPFNSKTKLKQLAGMSFRSQNVMLIGFGSDEGLDILKKIELLGGKFATELSNDVTVIIAKTRISKRLLDSYKYDIPIVTKEWIDNCFSSLTCFETHRYLMPAFLGMNITSTDLSSTNSKQISTLVKSNGGIWSDALTDNTTCLIAENICSSKKIKIALQSHIAIVKPKWVSDSCISKYISPIQYTLNWWIYDQTNPYYPQCKQNNQFFNGLVFGLHCDIPLFDELKEAIEACGGTIGPKPNYLIVPSSFQNSQVSSQKGDACFVTSHWIWDCISQSKLIDHNSSILYRPLSYSLPVKEVQGKVFALVDLDGANEMKHISAESIRILGGTVIYRDSKSADFYVTEDSTKLKEKLKEKHREVENKKFVSPLFVTEMIKTGQLPDPFSFPAVGRSSLLQHISMSIQRKILHMPKPNLDDSSINDIENSTLKPDDFIDFTQQKNYQSTQESDNDKITYETTPETFTSPRRTMTKRSGDSDLLLDLLGKNDAILLSSM